MAKKRVSYFVEINDASVVELAFVEDSVKAIVAELGYEKVPADGQPPAGKTVVGTSREDALELGCFPIRIAYKKGTKTQSALLLCTPTKADTVFKNLIGKSYAGNKISKVRPVRRRRYTMA